MARSRSLPGCLLISCIFIFLIICLDDLEAAMGYDLLLGTALLFQYFINDSFVFTGCNFNKVYSVRKS